MMNAKLRIFVYAFLAEFMLTEIVFGRICEPVYGPSGQSECLLYERNNGEYQWATCVTNAFVLRLSNGKKQCKRDFCLSDCMREIHNVPAAGPVYDDCACDREMVSTKSETDVIELPNWCHSPDGTICDWYTKCLETRYQCPTNPDNGHAVQYAKTFCNTNLKGKGNFSVDALRWINDVRKCLLVKLVPVIRPYANMSCIQMMKFALENQQNCYSEPYYDRTTICDLDLTNWAKVFWHLTEEFNKKDGAFLKDIIRARYQCVNGAFDDKGQLMDSDIGLISLTVVVSGNSSKTTEHIKITDSVPEQMAAQLQWNQKGVMWFPFIGNDSEIDEFSINILLGSRSVYDIKGIGFPEAKMSDIITNMAAAVATGIIFLHINDDLNVTKFHACLDFGCKGTYYSVTPIWGASTGYTILPMPFEAISVFILLYIPNSFSGIF